MAAMLTAAFMVLLASVAGAAEPWVLWWNVGMINTTGEWTPGWSFRSFEACEAKKVEVMRTIKPGPGERITKRTDEIAVIESGGLKGYARAVCLNVDPRR